MGNRNHPASFRHLALLLLAVAVAGVQPVAGAQPGSKDGTGSVAGVDYDLGAGNLLF